MFEDSNWEKAPNTKVKAYNKRRIQQPSMLPNFNNLHAISNGTTKLLSSNSAMV